MKRRAKLSAGRGWTQFLRGERTRPEGPVNKSSGDLEGDELLKALNRRLTFICSTMKAGDRERASMALSETMYLLRRAKDLPGDEERRNTMKRVVRWLGDAKS